MNVYVTTSDWYNPLIPAFAHLFNRFWSPDQPVTILGYTAPGLEMPANFSFESLGAASEFGNEVAEWSEQRRGRHFGELYPTPRWSDSLKRWLARISDSYFALLQIDYFIYRPVNRQQVRVLEQQIHTDNVMKVDLTLDRAYFAHSPYAECDQFNIVVSAQDALYRSSLQAAIWRSEYLDTMLKPGRSPWDFERLGMHEHLNDGKLILGSAPQDQAPVPYLNVYGQGKVNWRELNRLDPESMREITERGWIGPHWNGWTAP
ncbi:MAG TPA: hypothetical protein VK738_05410 [Terriglobales bacterium]|jgi:hypothetical protein|nr:hypothetical protein [Terriglobales bacterium]